MSYSVVQIVGSELGRINFPRPARSTPGALQMDWYTVHLEAQHLHYFEAGDEGLE